MTLASRQVAWFEVYTFVVSLLARTPSWPAAGTPEWCLLDDTNPRKTAAVLDAGVHWALKIDTEQTAQAELSQNLSTNTEWIKATAADVRNHPHHRIRRAS